MQQNQAEPSTASDSPETPPEIDIDKLPPHLREMWNKAGQRREIYLSQFEAEKAKARAARNRTIYRLQMAIIALIVYASLGSLWFWLFFPAGLGWVWYSRRLLLAPAAKAELKPPLSKS